MKYLGHKKDDSCICKESRVVRFGWIQGLKRNWTMEKGNVTGLGTKGRSRGQCGGTDHVAERWGTSRG